MKKTLFFFVLLLSAMSMSAQSLIGTWSTNLIEDGQRIPCNLTFANEKDLKMKLFLDFSDPDLGNMTFVVNWNGTYTKKSEQLNLNLNPATADVSLEKTKLKDEVKAAINSDPEMKKEFNQMVKQVIQETKKEVIGEGVLDDTMTIKSLTDKTLVLYSAEDKETITFTKVVK